MPEGVADAGGAVVDVGVGERARPPRPPDDPDVAPKGWTWDAKDREWRPAKRVVRRQDNGPSSGGTEAGEWRRAERDPEPARLGDRSSGRDDDPAKPPVPMSDDDRDDMEAVLAFAGMLLLPPICSVDPICGGAAADNWDKISAALVPVIARSRSVSAWVVKSGGLRDWLALGAALSPVGSAIVRHHVFHTVSVEGDKDEGDEEDLGAYVS